ncbi:putative uncharacterized protein [Bifidobacterium animalis subsp. lactis CECT 8145]|uniref:Uncharacterized protein n=1 Tax=Bifidobacterium animalis subsp. lactis CNCM I-2494 TaxID=1042403 RepID=A0A806FXD4_BIFAN|nr:hypothetical protein BALAC2494_01708 [Bifidobacterium animalis subsp. lactis CNCM I-2494]QIR81514.1 hypothetical protein M8PIadj_1500 [Bifidobacterium animalis]CDL70907.1 putative uncharacterized protein [Bifidobacterium animalis subsp. lactis CECT 8145]
MQCPTQCEGHNTHLDILFSCSCASQAKEVRPGLLGPATKS